MGTDQTNSFHQSKSLKSEIKEDGSVIWKGEPLTRISQVEEIVSHCQSFIKRHPAQSNIGEELGAFELLSMAKSAKQKLPTEEELVLLRPDIPPPPAAPTIELPILGKVFHGQRIPNYPRNRAFQAAIAKWEQVQQDYRDRLEEYRAMMPEFQRRVKRWNELHGSEGLRKLRSLHKRLQNRIHDLSALLSDKTEFAFADLEEILPPGSSERSNVLTAIEHSGQPLNREVRERIQFLEKLKPTKVFRGMVRRQYRDYLLFLFGSEMPAIVESPYYGNATYILYTSPLELCRLTKQELQQHPGASRLIHSDLGKWRQEVCRILGVPFPSGH